MLEKLNKEIILAMKSGDKFRVGVIKMIKSEVQADCKSAMPRPAVEVVESYRKKLAKNLALYQERPEQLETLKKELAIIDEFLPQPLTEAAVQILIDQHAGAGNFGQVMKAVRAELSGPFDGKRLAELIKQKLGAG